MAYRDTDLLFTGIPRTAAFRQYPTSITQLPRLHQLELLAPLLLDEPSSFQLIFVISGTLSVWDTNKPIGDIVSGHMYMLPFGTILNLRAEESGTQLFQFVFTPSLHLCAMQCPTPKQMQRVDRQFAEQPSLLYDYKITALPYSDGVRSWTESVRYYLDYEAQDIKLFDVKLQEFFILLRMSYAKADQDLFMRYFHCKDTGFRAKVYRKQLQWRTVEEMGESLGISHSQLKRLFADEFGMSPAKWLAEQKARYIYRDLIEGKMELADIAERYHFSSLSYMSVFSKKMFGDTPLKIRNESLLSTPSRKRKRSTKDSTDE